MFNKVPNQVKNRFHYNYSESLVKHYILKISIILDMFFPTYFSFP